MEKLINTSDRQHPAMHARYVFTVTHTTVRQIATKEIIRQSELFLVTETLEHRKNDKSWSLPRYIAEAVFAVLVLTLMISIWLIAP